MGETRQLATNPTEIIQIHFGRDETGTIGKYGDNLTPWINDHRMTMSFKAPRQFDEVVIDSFKLGAAAGLL